LKAITPILASSQSLLYFHLYLYTANSQFFAYYATQDSTVHLQTKCAFSKYPIKPIFLKKLVLINMENVSCECGFDEVNDPRIWKLCLLSEYFFWFEYFGLINEFHFGSKLHDLDLQRSCTIHMTHQYIIFQGSLLDRLC
jgi:hypothetical protein